jgi:hypothetical protein
MRTLGGGAAFINRARERERERENIQTEAQY